MINMEIRMVDSSLIQARVLLARQQLLHQQQHKRLARKIHDDISQHLTLLSLQLALAQSDPKVPANWAQNCKNWSNLVLAVGQNLRNIINEIQPRILDDLGLGAALERYLQSCPHGLQCQLLLPEQPVVLPPAAANELFAICRDVINEVFAPNGITAAVVVLEQSHDLFRLHLRVHEKNQTLAPLASKALDALSVRERLFCVDGSLETRQDPAEGFAITLSLPVSREAVSHAA